MMADFMQMLSDPFDLGDRDTFRCRHCQRVLPLTDRYEYWLSAYMRTVYSTWCAACREMVRREGAQING